MKKAQAGEAFLKSVLERIQDPGLKEKASALLADGSVVEAFGEGAMLRQDYSRNLDRLKAKEAEILETAQKQDAWWKANEPLVKLGQKVAAGEKPEPASKADPVPVQGVTAEQLNAALGAFAQQTLQLNLALDKLRARHFTLFGEQLDTALVVDLAQKRGINLEQAWQELTGERQQEVTAKSEEERINALVEERVKKALGAAGAAPPYPVMNGEPDILAALKADEEVGPAAAARDYRMGNFR